MLGYGYYEENNFLFINGVTFMIIINIASCICIILLNMELVTNGNILVCILFFQQNFEILKNCKSKFFSKLSDFASLGKSVGNTSDAAANQRISSLEKENNRMSKALEG